MNKIFKVIWSKSKQCYVVVSEMAKNTTGKKKIVVAGILASLAVTSNIMHVDAEKFGNNSIKTGSILIWGNQEQLPQVLMKMVLVSVKMQRLLLMAALLLVEMQRVRGMQYLWAGMQRVLVVMLPLQV